MRRSVGPPRTSEMREGYLFARIYRHTTSASRWLRIGAIAAISFGICYVFGGDRGSGFSLYYIWRTLSWLTVILSLVMWANHTWNVAYYRSQSSDEHAWDNIKRPEPEDD